MLEGRLNCAEAAQQPGIWISKMHDDIARHQDEDEDWLDEEDGD